MIPMRPQNGSEFQRGMLYKPDQRHNNPLQRSCSTCDARTIGNETYWTANRTTSKIIPDPAGRDDRRGIGAQESPKRSLVSGAGEPIIGDDATFIAVADPV